MGVSMTAVRPLSLVCLCVWSQFSIACSCPQDPAPLEQKVINAFQGADYAALLKITSTETMTRTREEPVAIWNSRTQQSEESTKVVRERLLIAKFTMLRMFKGDRSVTELETPAQSASCGVALKPGSQYLVYGYGPEDSGRISTNLCTRTALVEESVQDIEILNGATRLVSVVFQPTAPERRFNEALDLIHSYPDDDEKLSQALAISDELVQSDPLSGFSQALRAEVGSIRLLAANGKPVEQQNETLALIDEALSINPKLAHAHVAKARIYASMSRPNDANAEIQAALRMQPQLPSALFVQAEIYRRANDSAKAEEWMRYFISTSKQPVQKSNGHGWIANMWRDHAYHPEAVNREVNLLMARYAYQKSVDLDPDNARKLTTFAAFLNDLPSDFAAAEKYATRALALEEDTRARYQLAAARYQALQAQGSALDAESLRDGIAEVEIATGVSLDEVVSSGGFRPVIYARLTRLQIRAQAPFIR
jgi:tetratricopeptide (TPR) repeat protein